MDGIPRQANGWDRVDPPIGKFFFCHTLINPIPNFMILGLGLIGYSKGVVRVVSGCIIVISFGLYLTILVRSVFC